ncbi:MAG: radical SAM protein [Candidatus Altiarchaeota archaeon]
MNTLEKLRILGPSSAYDRCGCECTPREAKKRKRILPSDGIYPASTGDGRRTLLLKVLQSNECANDCNYCVNRCGRSVKRASFEPAELASLFQEYLRRGYVEGLFLSSGINHSEDSMERVLETVSRIRKAGFRGYVHTKILPGATREQVREAAELSTRLSINIEAPSRARLSELSTQKDYKEDILRRMKWIHDEWKKGRVQAGQTTQFIVGASDETDYEILDTTNWLIGEMRLSRTYYSAFNPVPDTPLEGYEKTPAIREHRLYQAEFLIREYGFKFKNIIFQEEGNMPYAMDPKMAYAVHNLDLFPIDAEDAAFEELLLVPGIGPKTARRILNLRGEGSGIWKILPKKAIPFLEMKGKKQARLGDFLAEKHIS